VGSFLTCFQIRGLLGSWEGGEVEMRSYANGAWVRWSELEHKWLAAACGSDAAPHRGDTGEEATSLRFGA
jgi:hypothetical protein